MSRQHEHASNQPLLANYHQPPPPYNAQPQPYNFPPQQPFAQAYPQSNPLAPNPGIYAQNQLAYALGASPCPYCRRDTQNFRKAVPGGATWMWCLGLFIFTGVFCCVPFCMDSCQDTQVVCTGCHTVKSTFESGACC